jgi:hypothetical protein
MNQACTTNGLILNKKHWKSSVCYASIINLIVLGFFHKLPKRLDWSNHKQTIWHFSTLPFPSNFNLSI